ncbi:hypothetical protein BHM03_00042338 [Ensete ventricosum]|nr:hypothetical protein BHM03_00042338 [Ensete ventricosum]
MGGNEFRFFFSCDINLPVTFRIERLEGCLPNPPAAVRLGVLLGTIILYHIEPSSVCFLSCDTIVGCLMSIFANFSEIDSPTGNKNAEIFVECTLYIDGAPFGLSTKTRFSFPFTFQAYVVWDVSCGNDNGLVGGTTVFLFNRKKQLKTGRQKLRLWPGKEADGAIPTTTPGKVIVRF